MALEQITTAATERDARDHGLTADEFKRIVDGMGRTPNIVELAVFSVMWSEHCSYKSSRRFLKQLPTQGPRVLQGPGENAGVVDIGDGLAVVFKMESHNHPSFVEPYQGAATGVGGILRDVFTMGARPIANLNSLRFGSFDHPRTRYLIDGVVRGVGDYGNCIGVPTVGGEVYFDPGYNENNLVNAMTVGLVRSDRIFRGVAAGVGNPVLYVGSKTGRDGIHGASLLASNEFSGSEDAKRPTVQVGDPFTEKLLLEACLELMEMDAIVAIQDMGAAGLTSSSVEMAGRGGTGIRLDLDRIPLREQAMTPYEILLSESQERMLIIVRVGAEEETQKVFAKWQLDAAVIGTVTDDGNLHVVFGGETAARIPIPMLTDDAPVYDRPQQAPDMSDAEEVDIRRLPLPRNYNETLTGLLDSPSIASKKWVYRQYDSIVRGNTMVVPGSDAAVLRIKGTKKAIAVSVDCNSRYCSLDPYVGAVIAVAESARNVVCAGATPLGITDCLNFGNPERPQIMWQFAEAIRGIRDACIALNVPVVGGNVSFYNETEGRAIPPTPTIGMVGLIEDAERHMTQWFKTEGSVIVLLGRTLEELGGSEYLSLARGGATGGTPPWIDLSVEKNVQQVCLTAIQEGLLESAHDVAEGGLAVALAESCITAPERRLGAAIDSAEAIRADALLFSESQSRIVVSLRRNNLTRLREIAAAAEVPFEVLGEVRGRRLAIGQHIDLDVDEMYAAWSNALPRRLEKGA